MDFIFLNNEPSLSGIQITFGAGVGVDMHAQVSKGGEVYYTKRGKKDAGKSKSSQSSGKDNKGSNILHNNGINRFNGKAQETVAPMYKTLVETPWVIYTPVYYNGKRVRI